jgi:predicted transcriptional regulator
MSTRYSAVSPLQARVPSKAIRKLQQRKEQDFAADRVTTKNSSIRRASYESEGTLKQAAERVDHSSAIKKPKWLNSDLKARDLMRTCELILRPEDSIERAARIMRETDSGAIPVVDVTGCLIGIVTTRDITMKIIAAGASVPHAQVSDCMTAEVFACSADNSLESCVSAMCWHQVKRIPIVDDEHRVLGTISQRDLAEYLFEQAERADATEMVDILWALAS